MKLSFVNQALVLTWYGLFFYLYWINQAYEPAVITIISLLLFLYVNKCSRGEVSLALAVALTHLILFLFRLTPYLRWPLDFFLLSVFGFLSLKFLLKNNVKLNWKLRLGYSELLSIAVINIPAVLILLWYYSENKEVAQQWPLPSLPVWSVPFVVLLIAVVNGLREEIYYRGLLQTVSFEKYSTWFVILFQAISFGPLHFSNAFPQGWIGVGLTSLWGAAIAMQYCYFRSISLSWLTHSIADAVMFSIIILFR